MEQNNALTFFVTLILNYFHVMDYIEQKPGVLGGKAVIKDTRIGVDLILEKIAAGETIEQLLKAYPFLNREAILACKSYGQHQKEMKR